MAHIILNKDRRWWRSRRWENLPERVRVPFWVGLVAAVGCAVLCLFSLLEPKLGPVQNAADAAGLMGRALAFWGAIMIKAYFGPIVLGSVVCYAVHHLFTHGTLALLPIFDGFADWLFGMSPYLCFAYTLLVLGVALAGSIPDHAHPNGGSAWV